MPSRDNVAYSSVKSSSSSSSPQKTRRSFSYFWRIALSLVVISAGVALAWFGKGGEGSQLFPTTQLGHPSSGDINEPADPASLSAPQSYHVDMDKRSWPELVGTDGEVAKATVQGENPSITVVQIIPKDSMVTMDYSLTRVRIFVDDDNKVARAPQIG
jgi:hypothetical protein